MFRQDVHHLFAISFANHSDTEAEKLIDNVRLIAIFDDSQVSFCARKHEREPRGDGIHLTSPQRERVECDGYSVSK